MKLVALGVLLVAASCTTRVGVVVAHLDDEQSQEDAGDEDTHEGDPPPLVRCGDGVLGHGEQCDDGGLVAGDGCDVICHTEPHYVCAGQPSVCACAPGFQDKDKDGVCREDCAMAAASGTLACGDFAACDDGSGEGRCVCVIFAAVGGAGDGRSFAAPLGTLQTALDEAAMRAELQGAPCSVWVAAGRYRVDAHTASDTLRLPAGARLLGGFAGTELAAYQRDLGAHATIIDGDNGAGMRAHHVLTAEAGVLLDGLQIVNGEANGANPEDQNGAGLRLIGGDQLATVRHCLFCGNHAASYGGALFMGTGTAALIEDSTFTDNVAFEGGAVAAINSAGLTISRCDFQRNQGTYGGALRLSATTATIADATFTSNQGDFGGACYLEASTTAVATSTLSSNRATSRGGAVFQRNGASTVHASRFAGNSAEDFGGAIQIGPQGSIDVADVLFTQNHAVGGAALSATDAGAVSVSHSRFFENQSRSAGGAVAVSAAVLTLTDALLSGNEAEHAGALLIAEAATALIDRCIFVGNRTTVATYGCGGAVCVDTQASLTLQSSVVMGNAAYQGGALGTQGGAGATVLCSTLAHNTALATGGGIFAAGSTLRLQGSLVAMNRPEQVVSVGTDCSIEFSALGLDAASGCALGTGNVEVTPTFAVLGSGTLDLVTPRADDATTLSDSGAQHAVSAFARSFLHAGPTSRSAGWAFVVDNDASSVTAAGSVGARINSGDPYIILDLRPAEADSVLRDAGGDGAISLDVEGKPRQCRDGTTGCPDIGAYELSPAEPNR